MDDVELGRPLENLRYVQHSATFGSISGPPTSRGGRRCADEPTFRITRRKEGDVVASAHEPFGQEGGKQLPWPIVARRDAPGNGASTAIRTGFSAPVPAITFLSRSSRFSFFASLFPSGTCRVSLPRASEGICLAWCSPINCGDASSQSEVPLREARSSFRGTVATPIEESPMP